jgi:hypothetical protein
MKSNPFARRLPTIAVACLATMSLAVQASAQRRQIGGLGITVFENPNFRGGSATFRDDVRDFKRFGLNDRASSLRIGPNEQWEVCEHANYRGRCVVVSGSERNLNRSGWNDRISSARRVYGGAVEPVPDRPVQVVLYRQPGYRGRSYTIESASPSLPGLISQSRSMRVVGGLWQLCDDTGFRGRCVTVSSNVPDLAAIGLRSWVASLRPRAQPR